MTAAIDRALDQARSRPVKGVLAAQQSLGLDGVDSRNVANKIEAMRSRAWFEVIRLSLGASDSADLERQLLIRKRIAVGDGAMSKYERGDRRPSETTLRNMERAIPGSRIVYAVGPYGSLLWSALQSDSIETLWKIVCAHYPLVGDMKSQMSSFSDIVEALYAIAGCTPYCEADPQYPLRPTRLALTDLRESHVLGLPNEYCLVAALAALYRLADRLHHPQQAADLFELLQTRINAGLRGVCGQLGLRRTLSLVIEMLNPKLTNWISDCLNERFSVVEPG